MNRVIDFSRSPPSPLTRDNEVAELSGTADHPLQHPLPEHLENYDASESDSDESTDDSSNCSPRRHYFSPLMPSKEEGVIQRSPLPTIQSENRCAQLSSNLHQLKSFEQSLTTDVLQFAPCKVSAELAHYQAAFELMAKALEDAASLHNQVCHSPRLNERLI